MEEVTMGNLINMEALSEEERAVILNVLRRDESLRKSENKKIGQLRLEIQTIRMKSVLRDGDDLSKICARCHAELGFLFNRGDMCPICHFKVCKLCQETLLIGKWLCSLCYKQRQLRWLQQGGMDSGPGGTLKRWPSGTELVKASIRKTLVIADPGTESDPGTERGLKQNGATIRNGSVYKDKAQQEPERIECPKDSDKRKLTQLFDTFKMPKKTESAEKKHLQTSVRRATSRRYGTDTESSSSSDEEMTSSLPASMLTSTSVQSSPAPSRVSGNDTTASEFEEIHVSDSVLHKTSESVNSSPRKSLQRKHSYDSDQTIHSDDAPFSKSSTETQIRVEVHSDASSTKSADICRPKTSPSKSASSNSQNSYKVKQSGHEGVKVTRKESSSSQRSSSPEMGGMRHVQVSRQCILQPGRSPSPYSFDSIPSSHANSPLPRQRILDQTADYPLQKNSSEDTDSLSRYSANEYSGTESSGHIRDGSSGADELMMDDVSKMKFHKLSKKVDTSKSKSPAHSPNTSSSPQLAERGDNCGRGRVGMGSDMHRVIPESINPQIVSQVSSAPSELQTRHQMNTSEPVAPVRRKIKVNPGLLVSHSNDKYSIKPEPLSPPRRSKKIKGYELVAPPRRSTSFKESEMVFPPKSKVEESELVVPPRMSKSFKESEIVVPPKSDVEEFELVVPPRRSRSFREPENVTPLNSNIDESDLVAPPRRSKSFKESVHVAPLKKSKVADIFEPISPPRQCKKLESIASVPPLAVPPKRRGMWSPREDIPSPVSSAPSSPLSFSGEDSSSERNLSIKDAKRLFEEKHRIERFGKSPRSSPRALPRDSHDTFFNDSIWRDELRVAAPPSPAPDDEFEALFSKAISDLDTPESPLPKIRSRSGSKSKRRPKSGEIDSDSETRNRSSTGELPNVKEPTTEDIKETRARQVVDEPDCDKIMERSVEQLTVVTPFIKIVVEDSETSQNVEDHNFTKHLLQINIPEPEILVLQDMDPSEMNLYEEEMEISACGNPLQNLKDITNLNRQVPVIPDQDSDEDKHYHFSAEEQQILAESEQSLTSSLWHFQETSIGNDFNNAFGTSDAGKDIQYLEVRSNVRASMGDMSQSDTSSDILSVITEDTEPSENGMRSLDSGDASSTIKASSNMGSDSDRVAGHLARMESMESDAASSVKENIRKVEEAMPYKVTTDVNVDTIGYHDDALGGKEVEIGKDKGIGKEPLPGTLLSLATSGYQQGQGSHNRGPSQPLEPYAMVQDTPEMDSKGTVNKKVFREKLVKQWLEAEVHSNVSADASVDTKTQNCPDKISDAQPPHTPTLDPCHTSQSSTPGTHPLDSAQIPGLPIGSISDTDQEKDVAPKLSPRASSEGSGSLEDSGHVSGTSTQDNTPEHRRTDSIQSQMSVPSTLSTVTDVSNKEDDCEVDIDELVASHKASTQSSFGSSHGNLLSTVADSRESIASFYSDAGGVNYGKVPVTGEIQFGIDYNYRTGTLEIAIRQCKELAPADPKRHRSDPYVKTYLLPDKTRGGKRKTRVKKNTLGPIFDETLRYLISKSEVENRILWVTVWHNDRFGRNDFLGEVSINFDYFRFGNSAPKWYPLQERVETQTTSLLTYQGDLILSLRLVSKDNVKEILTSPTKTKRKKVRPDGSSGCQLQVLLKEARNLTAVRSNGYSDPFCKGYLLPDKHKGLKQKTPVIKRECSPKWNYTFIFDDVSPEELKERALELTIWDHDKISSNDFLGGVRLNLGLGRSFGRIVDWNDAKGEEISMWQAMLDRPDSWIDGTLILRPNMDKRRY